jgi:hypothetical protein
MKNLTFSFLSLALLLTLAGCGATPAPADNAAKSGLSAEEYQQQKEQAARMGMDIESHTKMLQEEK